MKLNRQTFVRAAGGWAALALAGCGGGDGGDGDTSLPGGSGCADRGAITGNHGHTVQVPQADLTSDSNKTYAIDGAAGHGHTITLTPAQLKDLAAKRSVTVTSSPASSDNHVHSVTITCT